MIVQQHHIDSLTNPQKFSYAVISTPRQVGRVGTVNSCTCLFFSRTHSACKHMYIIARRLRYNVKETVTVEPNTLALRGPLKTSEVGQNTGVHPASSAMAATTDTQAQKYVLASPSRRATTSHYTSCAVDSLELAAGESEDDGVTSQARANTTDGQQSPSPKHPHGQPHIRIDIGVGVSIPSSVSLGLSASSRHSPACFAWIHHKQSRSEG